MSSRPTSVPLPGVPQVAASRPTAPGVQPLPGVPGIAPAVPGVPSMAAGVPITRPGMPAVRPPGATPVPLVAPLTLPLAPATAAGAAPAAAASGALDLTAEQLADLDLRYGALDTLDYFEVLKLERGAAPADIKRAFYRESRTYHPDRFFHLADTGLKDRVVALYKRVTEAYYVLRDDARRRQYVADVSGPERAQKLRFTEASEAEKKASVRREAVEQIGSHPKGRQFYQTGAADLEAGRLSAAERNFKMALTYEPQNALYKEKLAEAQRKAGDEQKARGGDPFKIK